MVLIFLLIQTYCAVLHFFNHWTFEKTKKGLFRIRGKHQHNGPYPIIFNVYCVLVVVYSIYLTTYFTSFVQSNTLSGCGIHYILFYPFSLILYGNESIVVSNINSSDFNLIGINSNILHNVHNIFLGNDINPLKYINVICFIFMFLFEAFFNFYRYFGIYNVQKYLVQVSLSTTLKFYLIYVSVFMVLGICNIIFINIFCFFMLFSLHLSFNVYCEYKQIHLLSYHNNNNPLLFEEEEFKTILEPLIFSRRCSLIATILSSTYLIGLYTFKEFSFLVFYPTFFTFITVFQTLTFIRNRLYFTTRLSSCSHCQCICCCKKKINLDSNTTQTVTYHINTQNINNKNDNEHINMTPICEDIEAGTNHNRINELIKTQSMPTANSTASPVSNTSGSYSQLYLKSAISPSNTEDHIFSIHEQTELIDFTGIVSPASSAMHLSPSYVPPTRQTSNNERFDIKKFLRMKKDRSYTRSIETNELHKTKQIMVLSPPKKDSQTTIITSNQQKQNGYFESAELVLMLSILVGNGLAINENALNVKSLKKLRLRKIKYLQKTAPSLKDNTTIESDEKEQMK